VQGQARELWMRLYKKAARGLLREIALLLDQKPASTPRGRHPKVIQKAIPVSTPDERSHR